LKQPWSIERAKNFVLPYGRYKGKTIAALAESVDGRHYLEWLAANVEKGPGIAASILLEERIPDAVRNR
jgi:uncharacterized protein (DUF3820 family)